MTKLSKSLPINLNILTETTFSYPKVEIEATGKMLSVNMNLKSGANMYRVMFGYLPVSKRLDFINFVTVSIFVTSKHFFVC